MNVLGLNKPKLLLFCADKFQITSNCFIRPLVKTLKREFKVVPVTYDQLLAGHPESEVKCDLVLSVLKQRSWMNASDALKRILGDRPIFFYDQDPWEAYHDNASSPGAYTGLASQLNVQKFLVTSKWWANYIGDTDNLPASFVRMGMLPSDCVPGKPFSEREIEIGFQGTLHSHRKAFFDRMKSIGVDTTCLPSVPYNQFLKNLNNIGVYLHDEKADVKINGVPSLNGIWVKEIEAAARGAFSIRNYEEESEAYGISELPIVMPFRQENDIPEIIETIRSMPERERNERRLASVARIKERDDWMTVVRALQAD